MSAAATTTTTFCSKCDRPSAGPGDMWESVSNGVTWFECRTHEAECRAIQQARKKEQIAAAAAEFFAQYGISKDELTTEGQPHYRDAHRRYVHPPTGRTFKVPFNNPNCWTETTGSRH